MESTVLTPPKPQAPSKSADYRRKGNGPGGESFGGDGWWESPAAGWSVPARTYRTGMYMALAAIVMLFAAFTSAMIVRRGISNDWVPTALPHILYVNTIVLLASSATLEFSRRSLIAKLDGRFLQWLYVTMLLGLAFVGGQLLAWRQLASRGVYLATNPSSSFFYLLTASHGIHLLGGIGALFYLALWARKLASTPRRRAVVDVAAIYWHFMDGLWVFILLLLIARL